MKNDSKNPRLAHLQSEVDARAAPAVLLAAAFAALSLWFLPQLLPANPAPVQDSEQTLQESAPAA